MTYLSRGKYIPPTKIDLKGVFETNEFLMGGAEVLDKMHPLMIYLLVELRNKTGIQMILNSTYRDSKKNKLVGGAANSWHLYGCAVDFRVKNGADRAKFIKEALLLGLSVGVMNHAIHIDIRAFNTPNLKFDEAKQILFHYYN